MSERYHPSPDQTSLARSLGESIAALLPLARLHDAGPESAASWTALRELGVFEVSMPEAHGGSGLGAVEEVLIALELGRRAAAPSVFATMGAVHLLAPHGGPLAPRAVRVAAGYRRGARTIAIDDPQATHLLVRGESAPTLFALPAATRPLEDRLWSAQLLEVAELGSPVASGEGALELRLRLIDAAALAGLSRAALDMAVAYAGLREQFGRPIGSFQAVKHHCANMALAARCAADQVAFAAVAIDDGRSDLALQVESAFVVAGSAALDNTGKNIQVHGGIGFSDEADPHRLLKRARVLVEIGGGLEAALARVADCPPIHLEVGGGAR